MLFMDLFIYLLIQYLYMVSILAEASLSRALIKIKGYYTKNTNTVKIEIQIQNRLK